LLKFVPEVFAHFGFLFKTGEIKPTRWSGLVELTIRRFLLGIGFSGYWIDGQEARRS